MPPTEVIRRVASDIVAGDHPYLRGAWTPLHEEVNASGLEVIAGRIPTDIDGVYLRNTQNQVHEPLGRFHIFDADGMIHMMSFHEGRAEYRNRFVRTKGFITEQEAGGSVWAGIMEPPTRSKRPGWGAQQGIKDASSTDVVVHAGRGLSTYYQCGEGYRFDPLTLEPQGTESWVPLDGISAHPKVDECTGELLFFNYSTHAPYMHYGVVDASNRLVHYVPIPLPGPRLPHDMAFTEHYAILNDLPLFWDPELLKQGQHAVRFHPEIPSRFAILPRRGGTADIRWFEAAPTYVLHWLNAWEEGDEIVMVGTPYRMHETDDGRIDARRLERTIHYRQRDFLLYEWRFDLKRGTTRERVIDDVLNSEFPVINTDYQGRPNRWSYNVVFPPGGKEEPRFPGLVKYDLQTGGYVAFSEGPHTFYNEPGFAPRDVREIVAMAKEQPGKLAYGSPGAGTGMHMAGELFNLSAGIQLVHVAYRGNGPMVNDLLGGQIPLAIGDLAA